ncbi:MAG: hypothetical protein ACTSX0_13830 [Promethearchaeota archaeon]
MGVFLDSDFFLGLLHRKDPQHDTCRLKFKNVSSGQFVLFFTSSYVISETATLQKTTNNLKKQKRVFNKNLFHWEL